MIHVCGDLFNVRFHATYAISAASLRASASAAWSACVCFNASSTSEGPAASETARRRGQETKVSPGSCVGILRHVANGRAPFNAAAAAACSLLQRLKSSSTTSSAGSPWEWRRGLGDKLRQGGHALEPTSTRMNQRPKKKTH